MNKIIALLLAMIFTTVYSFKSKAQNLVPNPSFEQYDTCPNNGGEINYASAWFNPLEYTSPDYFNACDTFFNRLGVPQNYTGYEIAHTGNAYAGICTAVYNPFVNGFQNYREYLEIALTSGGDQFNGLQQGKEYCVSFYVSAGDSVCYVADKIGAYFSSTFVSDTCEICNLKYIPQIEDSSLNNLSTRFGWKQISGKFIASGGEKYIVIGNFRDSTDTKSTFTNWSVNCWRYQYVAYYYIDDISVTPCDSSNGINENTATNPFFSIFPNPSSGIFTVNNQNHLIKNIFIHNVIGELIYKEANISNDETQIDLTSFSKGIYIINVNSGQNNYNYKLLKN